jgi:hypothetical protein
MPEIVITKPVPSAMSKLDFLKRLTFAERVAIETAAETDPEVRVVKQSLLAADEIRVDDSEMVAGIELYFVKGLILEERKMEILA